MGAKNTEKAIAIIKPGEIGERIKKLRKQKGMTLEKFADSLMVSTQTVCKWQRGASLPDISNFLQISIIYDVSIDYLVKGEEGDNEELSPSSFYRVVYRNYKLIVSKFFLPIMLFLLIFYFEKGI